MENLTELKISWLFKTGVWERSKKDTCPTVCKTYICKNVKHYPVICDYLIIERNISPVTSVTRVKQICFIYKI